jgi:phosphoribosylformylglycinamidine synthase
MRIQIFVRLKAGVLDVQGKAVERGIPSLQVKGVSAVRIGRLIELDIEAEDFTAAKVVAERLCKELLANTVMEDFEIREAPSGSGVR